MDYRNVKVAMIVISDGKTNDLREMTQNCINSALINSNDGNIDVIVFEKTQFKYKNAITIHYDDTEFNYNKIANQAIKMYPGYERYLICNNDLVFHGGWLKPMIDCKMPVVSSLDPTLKKQMSLKTDQIGYTNKVHFSSWCFMIDKNTWNAISGFDEDFGFWYADDSFLEQLKKTGVPACIAVNSKVTHLRSQTLKTIDDEDKSNLTTRQYDKFFNKYIKTA